MIADDSNVHTLVLEELRHKVEFMWVQKLA